MSWPPNVSRDEEGTLMPVLHWDEQDKLDTVLGRWGGTINGVVLSCVEEVKEGEIKKEGRK